MLRFVPWFLALLLIATVVAILPVAHPADPKEGRKVAILVGVGSYKHHKKENQLGAAPVNDVTDMAKLLKENGYRVVVLTDADATHEAVLEQFQLALDGKTSPSDKKNALGNQDTLLVMLCGHGIQVEATIPKDPKDPERKNKQLQPFFQVYDSKPTDTDTMVPFNQLVRMAGENAVRTMFLVDACRSNTDPNQRVGRVGITHGKAELPTGVSVLYSCQQAEEANQDRPDNAAGHGLFTQSVLRALRGETGLKDDVSWSELVAAVNKDFRTSPEIKAKIPMGKTQTPDAPQGPGSVDVVLVKLKGNPIAPPESRVEEKTETYTWKGESRKRVVRTLKCGTTTMEFVKVPKGSFIMGSDKAKDEVARDDETPAHEVKFTKDLWVAKYPVTKGQFAAFVKAKEYQTEPEADGKGGFGFDGKSVYATGAKYTWKETGWEQSDKHPVVNVTWNDAAAFCDWMSGENKLKSGFVKEEGKWDLTDYKKPVGVRLLTEAEYEYANRGGEQTIYITGDKLESLEGYVNIADKSAKAKWDCELAVVFDDGEPFTSPVGKYKANGFGLYDMMGNVWSWSADWYDAKLYGRGDVTDPGANSGGEHKSRVLRGGSWYYFPWYSRAAHRFGGAALGARSNDIGFRVCVVLD